MKRILNVGCGQQTHGTDFADIYLSCEDVVQCDMGEGPPFEMNTFDEVNSRCLFEHLRNPFSLLMEMKRVAKEVGTVRIITDNGSYWAHALKI